LQRRCGHHLDREEFAWLLGELVTLGPIVAGLVGINLDQTSMWTAGTAKDSHRRKGALGSVGITIFVELVPARGRANATPLAEHIPKSHTTGQTLGSHDRSTNAS